ncbi:MAG: ABC transporter ATP-binding protein [Lentisphaeria bacterium]|nr:ABC transporter ATP-binding protein [Lentisphaeria bacterium]
MTNAKNIKLEIKDLVIGYGDRIVLQDLNFHVRSGEIFCIMGGSGCGKSTLLKHIIGLFRPQSGDILISGQSIVNATAEERRLIMRHFGVTYQGGALFGSMTVAENIALPLREYTDKSRQEIEEIVNEKLELVDLAGFGNFMPSELSGGMCKRAGLARALALNPDLLFFDEPSAGLDPITSAGLDRLILSLREQFNTTIVVVTHELDSVFAIADRVIMLDKASKTIVADGSPADLRAHSENAWVREFLSRDGLKRNAGEQ